MLAFGLGLVLAVATPMGRAATPPPTAVGVTVYGYRLSVASPRALDCARLTLTSRGVPLYVAGAKRSARGCDLVTTTTVSAVSAAGVSAHAGRATYPVLGFAKAYQYTPVGTAVMPR